MSDRKMKKKSYKKSRHARAQTCWMPWIEDEKRFESWIFGSRKDCSEWITYQNDGLAFYKPIRVYIAEILAQ